MGVLSWIILGLIAGALAKWLLPGKDSGGLFKTMLLGIAGGFVGGWLGSLVGMGGIDGLGLVSIVTATAGAFLLLYIHRQLNK